MREKNGIERLRKGSRNVRGGKQLAAARATHHIIGLKQLCDFRICCVCELLGHYYRIYCQRRETNYGIDIAWGGEWR